jgi:phage-related protein
MFGGLFSGLANIGKTLLGGGGGLGKIVSGIGNFVKPLMSKVGDFVKPLWSGVKSVASFIPGGDMLTDTIEGVGKQFLGGAEEEAEGAQQDLSDMMEAVQDTRIKNLRGTQDELMGGLSQVLSRGKRIKDLARQAVQGVGNAGRQFGQTLRSKKAWEDKYAQPDDPDEDEYYERRRRARQARRTRRRRYDDEEDFN